MLFSSLPFLYYFLPVVLMLYFLVPKRLKNGVLLLGSLLFYGWGEPKYLLLMALTILVFYLCGIALGRAKTRKRLILVLGIAVGVALLAVFKYGDFFLSTLNGILGTKIPLLRLALPVGISFYTFQCVSYAVDVYRGDAAPQKNIVSFGAYVTMFPQLIAGPIVRYVDVETALCGRSHTWEDFALGLRRFLIGLGKKVLLANQLGALTESYRASPQKTVGILIVAVKFTTDILRPVNELNKATEAVAKGNFEVRASVSSQDEFADLAQSFNDMAANMQELLDRAKEDERKMRHADLRLLQEQINPHFLYNTLDTIVWLIEADETEKATEMVVTLSTFFRIVLSKGKEMISIREEEQHIASYLQIQEVRYHDILEYDIQIDKVLYDYNILKLTLQPLVENALYHGIKYKRAKGYIHIHGEKEGDLIHLTVRDNGVGMSKEELSNLREIISRPCQETEKGFGLANVNERIRMYFGPEYGMKIDSQQGEGTVVEITIPAVK